MGSCNLERLRLLYEHWSQGDFKSDEGFAGEDFEWRQDTEAVEPGTRRGAEGAARMARGVFDIYENFRIVPLEFIEVGDRIVVVSRIYGRSRRTGIEFERPYVLVWSFRGRQPLSVDTYRDRAEALQAIESQT